MHSRHFRVRDMTLQDIGECGTIVLANWDYNIALQAQDEMYEMFNSNSRWPPHYYVAEDKDGKIVGFAGYKAAWLMSNVYELIWINVHPDYHGQGIGSLLTDIRLLDIKEKKGALVMLMTQKPAFFEKFGFKIVENIDGWMLMLNQISPLKLGQRS